MDGTVQIHEETVPFTGYIAWSKRGDWHLNIHGRMGIRFTHVLPEVADLVASGTAGTTNGVSAAEDD